MGDDRWERLQQLFAAAAELEAAERERFVERECADDPELRAEVEKLLKSGAAGDDSLFTPIREAVREVIQPAPPQRQNIGPYKVLREIGRGGMGAVYLASRDDDEYRKDVAIKVVPGAPHSGDLLQRFRAERQILATLEHPNIARLLDGGATEDRLPYLVMEYVEGQAIDLFCNRNKLTIDQRLHLVLDVCAAVQHAHSKLVVHRDLKPANILVTADGVPKLLDFGIAKLLDPAAAGESGGLTRTAQRLMTPEYASPEQVRGEAVGTYTDVYALGVLLYEILTGQTPYPLRGRQLTEIEQAICREEPLPPSARVTKADDTVTLAEARGSRPEALRRTLRGDLDDIVLMALRKEPERRYPSVELLARDIKNYLEGRPVTARPDTWSYRTGKFLRRHAWPVVAATVFVLTLAAFGATMAVQAQRIADERDTAQVVTEFLVEMFEVSDPREGRADQVTARDLLDTATDRIDRELAGQPLIRERLLGTIGRANLALGEYRAALPLLEQRLELSRASSGNRSKETAEALNRLGEAYIRLGQIEQAEPLLEEALDLYRSLYDADDPINIDLWINAAEVHDHHQRYEKSEELIREAHRVATAAYQAPHEEIARTLTALAEARLALKEFEQSIDHHRQAVAMHRDLAGGEESLAYGRALMDLSTAHHEAGDYASGYDVAIEVLRVMREHLPETHSDVGLAEQKVGSFLLSLGRYDEAIEHIEDAIAILRASFGGQDHSHLAATIGTLGTAYTDMGQLERGRETLTEAYEMSARVHGENHRLTGWMLNNLALVEYDLRDCADAKESFRKAAGILGGLEPPERATAVVIKGIGMAQECLGETEQAEESFLEAVRIGRRDLPAGHSALGGVVAHLGGFMRRMQRYEEAADLLTEGIEIRLVNEEVEHLHTLQMRVLLGDCLRELGRYGEAEAQLLRAYEADHAGTRQVARQFLVQVYELMGEPEKAAQYEGLN